MRRNAAKRKGKKKKKEKRDFTGGPVVTPPSDARDVGSIPG